MLDVDWSLIYFGTAMLQLPVFAVGYLDPKGCP